MAIAKQSKNANQYNPDTGANFGEWWRKTVIRRISKYLPSSSDRDEFMQAVERIDEGFDYEATDGGPTEPAPQPAKKRGAGAAALKDVTPKQAAPQQQQTAHDPETGEIIDADETAPQPGDDI
jgi:recombination protein RecT